MTTADEIEQFCVKNQPLVRYVISRCFHGYMGDEDVFQVGMIGLYKAAKKFDAGKGVKFSTYAFNGISLAIRFELRNRRQFAKLPVVSYDAEIGDGNISLLDTLSDNGDAARAMESGMCEKSALDSIMGLCRNQRDKKIIMYRLSGLTQAEIAERLSTNQAYVSRLLRRVKQRVRADREGGELMDEKKAPEGAEKDMIAIFTKKSISRDGREGYDWAWEESMNKKVFGWNSSLADVERRAAKMFPGKTVQLVAL